MTRQIGTFGQLNEHLDRPREFQIYRAMNDRKSH